MEQKSFQARQVIRHELDRLGLRHLASLSQNFLADPGVIHKVCQVVRRFQPQQIIEVGPGLGALTFPLASGVRRFVAVEIDRGLAAFLHRNKLPNIEVHHQDALVCDVGKLGQTGSDYVLVSNLPFSNGTAILRHFFESKLPPRAAVVVVQKEIGERILVKDQKESLLSLATKLYGSPRFELAISRQVYEPVPRVDTMLLSISRHEKPWLPQFQRRFLAIVRAGFSARRKFLVSNLRQKLKISAISLEKALGALGYETTVRAERLSFDDWIKLTNLL
jgi:16S rRNA (adenine1518-N6/adenine1519-N6)-dimethyltransferase